MDEAETHPQNAARDMFVTIDGVCQPAPGPRFSATPPAVEIAPEQASRSDPHALGAWGFNREEIEQLRQNGILS
jgi:crotonobetainyl-CoA:carnitine CoA-transferase CaiB-like acyl-CoA transferase